MIFAFKVVATIQKLATRSPVVLMHPVSNALCNPPKCHLVERRREFPLKTRAGDGGGHAPRAL